jgi:osmotically-inducible protein OsmY
VNAFDVTVEVEGSIVTLRGTVDNLKARRSAERDARLTSGVSFVRNRIKVQSGAPSDTPLAERVRAALGRNPLTGRHAIDVSARDGVVYLKGVVDSRSEKAEVDSYREMHAALENAYEGGATRVDNDLVVR